MNSLHERRWTGEWASDGSSGMLSLLSLEASGAAVAHTLAATAARGVGTYTVGSLSTFP